VIGTLAIRAERSGYRVHAVSSDKDFLQLVSNRVSVIHPGKDIRYDPKAVEERFGVPPEKVIDVLALMGDSVDNVPGVPGIGEKGAIRLIQEWGSLEACLENAEKIKNKRQREGLQQFVEQARLSKTLVRIVTDVPLDLDLESLRYGGARREQAFSFFEKLGFTSLLKDYLPESDSGDPVSHRVIEKSSDLERVVATAGEKGILSIALTSEADESSAPVIGVGLAVQPGEGFYVPMIGTPRKTELSSRLGSVLSDPSIPKAAHDFKKMQGLLLQLGIELGGIVFDAMIASYLLNPAKRSHDLDSLALEVLQKPLTQTKDAEGEQKSLPGLGAPPSPDDGRPAAERAEVVLRLRDRLEPRIEAEGLAPVFREIELPLISVLADMEQAGIGLDVDKLRSLSKELGAQLETLTREIYELAGVEFNVNSPKQVGEILFEKMNMPTFQKTKKQRVASTRMEVLEELAEHFELPRKILDYRSLAKLKGTYVDALPELVRSETGRIHTSFNQAVAATGRLSSSEPNLQNIPIRTELGRRIRTAFVAAPGWQLLSADYSQVELRVLAHMSREPTLIDSFRQGEDIHRRTADQMFGDDSELSEAEQRRRAKIINFSIIYGKTAFTLAKDIGVSNREAQAFIDDYFESHSMVRQLLDGIIREARTTGKVKTLFGRHRYIPGIESRNRNTRQAAERVAVNAPIQGTAADLIKKAMVQLWNELRGRGMRTRMLLQVHDELVLEVPEEEVERATALVREVMEGVHPMEVPLKVEIAVGRSWLH
jgi:DNA polymerase-1